MSPVFERIVKFPSKSVWVPVLLPFTSILTPGMGSPLVSFTVPVTVFFWAMEDKPVKRIVIQINLIMLKIILILY